MKDNDDIRYLNILLLRWKRSKNITKGIYKESLMMLVSF